MPDAAAHIPTLPKHISVEELADPSNCLSDLHQRPFLGQTDYEGAKALDEAHAAATQALPAVESAYKPCGKIAGRKFCEETGFFLEPLSRLRLKFDFAENALALLKRGEYQALASLPRAEELDIKKKHFAQVVLWGHDQAATAYLEVEVHFAGNSKPVKKISLEESKTVRVKWLAFSARLDETQTRSLLQTFPAG
jgi:hypothetical protein